MKPKLWKILTVCLLTLVVLSPALVLTIWVWQKHLEFAKTQHLLSAFKDAQKLTNHGANPTEYVLLWLLFLAPISLGLGMALHNRYVVYRAAVLQKQIKMLERMWHSSTYRHAKIKMQNQ